MIQVLGDRVLVALPPTPDELVTASGLVLVKDPDRHITPSQGIVVQVGEKSGTVDLDDVRAAVREYFDQNLGNQDCLDPLDNMLKTFAPAAFDVAVGECVLFSPASGEEIEDDGIRYVILRESEIIGVVEPNVKKNEAA